MAEPLSTSPDTPTVITNSPLWRRIIGKPEYVDALLRIRFAASLLASTVSTLLPEYTDHSVRHMDQLWNVAAQVLTRAEMDSLNSGEAFLLGAAFYLHDLGMALPATNAGKDKIRATEDYQAAYRRFTRLSPGTNTKVDELAIREATRELHAQRALELVTRPLPGLDRYLIEDSDFRDRWAHTVGQIAESHHWPLEQIERSLGARKAAPGPDRESIDLAYVACVLRIIDFAHINRERALGMERDLRSEIPENSSLHWDAQASVTGPERDSDLLVFGCTKPLEKVDAWWLFYDLASGLDAEIRSVDEYLRNRSISGNRFSLKGVKGVENPASFNQFVRLPATVLPIDIRVQPNSMERVVDLLGGAHIYGVDKSAPIRELIQNARDAIELRRCLEIAEGYTPTVGEITVSLEQQGEKHILKVRDNGIGMTRTVVKKHLLGVGSDFWRSVDFARDFGKAIDTGFRPIGKFGIGFLSVFMLGDLIEVETEAVANSRMLLTLRGVGRRGELQEKPSTGHVGTEVRIELRENADELMRNLVDLVRSRAPMLPIPIVVRLCAAGSTVETRIEPSWWEHIDEESMLSFVKNWRYVAYEGRNPDKVQDRRSDDPYHWWASGYRVHVDFGGKWSVPGWPATRPQHTDATERLISLGGATSFGVVICSQGIAVDVIDAPDITGVSEIGTVELTVSRDSLASSFRSAPRARRMTENPLIEKLKTDIRPAVIVRVNDLDTYGMLPGRINFLRGLASVFGDELLKSTTLSWIPVTEPPGNLIHYSRQGLLELLAKNRRILLAVGISPGGAYSVAFSQIPSSELSKMLVIALRKEEVDVPYELKNRLEHEGRGDAIQGPLDHLISTLPQVQWNLVLSDFLLKCVAEGWNTSIENLRGQRWTLRYKDDILWVDLVKP